MLPMRTQSSWLTSPDDILAERTDFRPDTGFVEEIQAEARRGRKAGPDGGNHAGDVGIGGFERDAGLEPRDAFIAELAQRGLVAVELQGQKESRFVPVEEMEVAGHDADDLVRLAIER